MKLELCSFSGFKVYPGRGRWLIRTDGKTFHFLNSKCERSHYQKKNPREVSWTVLYRRKHKKGQVEEAVKKKSRKSHKAIRAVAGLSMADLMAKRNQKPEFRKAQREQAVRNAKEKAKAKEAEKKAQKQAESKQSRGGGGAGQKQKAAKVVKPSAPRVGGKR